ncbi:hypothetical protein JOM56_009313 [Amanita muscaria]
MHFSPITVGVTALFVLARLAVAASSDHVDVATAPLPQYVLSLPITPFQLVILNSPGQLKPTHSRYAPHHRHEGGENRFYYDHDSHPSKGKRLTGAAQEQEGRTKLRQRQLMPPSTQRAVNNMLMGALFRRASTKSHSTSPGKSIKVNYGNMEKQSMSISQKVSLAGNEYQAVQKSLAGIPGAARNSLAQRGVKILREFSQLQSLYSRQNKALQAAQSSYRGTETKGKNLWGRELKVLPRSFNALSRRAPTKSHSAPAKSITINSGSLAQLEKQTLAIGAKVDEAWREQQALRKAGAGWAGAARTAMDQLGNQIDVAFKQLHSLLHQPLPQSSYQATESKDKALWGRAQL